MYVHTNNIIMLVTITCGNIKLMDIELEMNPNTVMNNIEPGGSTVMVYHCAESISTNLTVSSACSSDEVSRWNPDPTSHGCVSATSGD